MVKATKSRIGVLDNCVTSVEGLSEHCIVEAVPKSKSTGFDNSDGDSTLSDEEDSNLIYYNAPPNHLPYPKDVYKTAFTSHVKPNYVTLPRRSITRTFQEDIIHHGLSPQHQREMRNIGEAYEELDAKSGGLWKQLRKVVVERVFEAVYSHNKLLYAEETIFNATMLFDEVLTNELKLTERSVFRITTKPEFYKCGLSKEEISTIMCACVHVSCKLSHVRHLQSKKISNVFNTHPSAIHLFEMILLQKTQARVIKTTVMNLLSLCMDAVDSEPAIGLVQGVAAVVLCHSLTDWAIVYSSNYTPFNAMNAAIMVAERLLERAEAQHELFSSKYGIELPGPFQTKTLCSNQEVEQLRDDMQTHYRNKGVTPESIQALCSSSSNIQEAYRFLEVAGQLSIL